VRNRFPSPASLKQPEDVLQEEWYKIPLCSKIVQVHFKKDWGCTAGKRWSSTRIIKKCAVFPLFCPTPVTNNKFVWTLSR
jgi:hypothetical protein